MNARRPRGRFQEGPSISEDNPIDYKNIDLLSRFTDTGGRIRSRRRTRTNARNQRAVTVAIKRARHLALLPFTGDHVRLYGADD